MSTERSVDVDSSVSFSEISPEYPEEETERGRKNVITICNGADVIVYVELHPIELVRRSKTPIRNIGFGIDVAPLKGAVGANLQVNPIMMLSLVYLLSFVFCLNSWALVRWTMRRRCWRAGSKHCTHTPLATSTSPRSTSPKITLRRRFSSITVSPSGHSDSKSCHLLIFECFIRLFFVKHGVRVEIGDGYSVGPGHGLIISKIGDNIRVKFSLISEWYSLILLSLTNCECSAVHFAGWRGGRSSLV